MTCILFNVKVELDGLTGKIKFDSRGLRVDFELEIVELKKDGLQKVRSLKNTKDLVERVTVAFEMWILNIFFRQDESKGYD